MLSISLDQHKEGGIFRMCVLAARRAQDLSQGALPLLPHEPGVKVTILALREVLDNVVLEKDENPSSKKEVNA